ncbi:hypothetical protein Droror1_Dr00010189 [Drosera rotundifolia]
MAEIEEPSTPPPSTAIPDLTSSLSKPSISSSISIWPPTQRTRDAVITRLIETLSQPSFLSKRYGSLSAIDASATARSVEEEAFVAASESGEEDGIEVLQVYSREISRRMLFAVKSKGVTVQESERKAETEIETKAVEAESEEAEVVEKENESSD